MRPAPARASLPPPRPDQATIAVLVSVIIPACAAEATIGRCVASLLAQTYPNWEGIIVADDARDYAAVLAAIDIADSRLRFVSTGKVRSGCHNARSVGLLAARGELIAQLDADDLYDPRRLAALAPLAAAHGAAVDRVAVISAATGAMLYTAPSCGTLARLSADALLDLGAPLFPVLRRTFATARPPGIEYAEDVIANLRLIEQIGPLPLLPCPYYRYRVVEGSLCHSADSGLRFEAAYSAYLARLGGGDGLTLVRTRAAAQRGFVRKRIANRRFMQAQRRRPGMTFQDFMAPYDGSLSRAIATTARVKL